MILLDTLPERQWLIIVTVVLFIIGTLATCAETATIGINDARLKKLADQGDRRAVRLYRLVSANSSAFKNAMEFLNVILPFAISAFAAAIYAADLRAFFIGLGLENVFAAAVVAIVIIAALAAFIYMAVCRFIARGVAGKNAEKMALRLSLFTVFTTNIIRPLVWIPKAAAGLFLRLFGVKPGDKDDDITEEEIRMMVDIGLESGAIDDDEKEMIHNIFELDDTDVEDIMTHRTDVDVLWINDGAGKWEQVINETNHTRYPVCGDSIDDVIGTLNIRDFYRLMLGNRNGDLRSIIREPYFVPESIKADELLARMQAGNIHIAVVMDEYGGFVGIATIEDILEEIVGELYSEYDPPEENRDIIRIGENAWIVRGSADLDDVSEELGVALRSGDYNTIAGLIIDVMGTVPNNGDTPVIRDGRLEIHVRRVFEHRIEEALVVLKDADEENASEENAEKNV